MELLYHHALVTVLCMSHILTDTILKQPYEVGATIMLHTVHKVLIWDTQVMHDGALIQTQAVCLGSQPLPQLLYITTIITLDYKIHRQVGIYKCRF